VADVTAILAAIAGHDPGDKASLDAPVADYAAAIGKKFQTFGVGLPKKFFFEDLDAEVASATNYAISALAALGAEIRDIEIPVPTDRTLQSAEAYAFHAEFVARNPDVYQPETLPRIRTGQNVSPEALIESRRELEQARRDIVSIFADVDVLVTPTMPIAAPTIVELKQNPDRLRPQELLLLRNTRPVNVWGLPAISIPCGFTQAGLPIGLQIIGPPWGESAILRVAHAYEQATNWHKREPVSS
jgi:aspartyl-tRNA(Asn)/glutamyl-tRNA(Gln) amidotransferase subunit A